MEIVNVVPFKNLNICLDTENSEYLRGVHRHFEHFVKNYMFMPKYQSGWNGKKSFFSKSTRSLPYGLLLDLVKFTNKQWKNIKLVIDDDIKAMYKGIEPEVKWDLLYSPHYYQEEVILSALGSSKGIFKCPTASGKSLMISYIIKSLLELNQADQCLIVVPTIGLVDQFKGDMIDYFIDHKRIGMVNKDYKEWNKEIVVSTWQSLKNNLNMLYKYNTIIVDETHGVRGDVLLEILKESNAFWRFGFTGTMPDDPLESLQVRSYLGPILKSYKSSVLAEEGYIATCNIAVINVNYNGDYTGQFSDIKNNVFASQFRLEIISSIVKNVNSSILLLVDKVEKEGCILEEYLKNDPKLKGKQIVFLHGNIDIETRVYWQKKCHSEDNIVIVATFGIFQLGINIKSLKYAVLCSSFKSSIRILQSIGRALRKHKSKDDTGAYIFDINDQVKFLDDHGKERLKFYEREEFSIKSIDISESQPIIDFKELY